MISSVEKGSTKPNDVRQKNPQFKNKVISMIGFSNKIRMNKYSRMNEKTVGILLDIEKSLNESIEPFEEIINHKKLWKKELSEEEKEKLDDEEFELENKLVETLKNIEKNARKII